MKLHILSDLHNEFVPHQAHPAAVAAADVIVLAGDIDQGTRGLAWAREAFPNHEIVYVAGNHEFYHHHWNQLLVDMRLKADTLGIHFLEDQAVMIGGIRFLGASLWTDYDYFGRNKRQACMREAEEKLNDFRLIKAQTIQPERVSAILGTADGKKGAVRWSRKLTAVHTLERHQASMAWLQAELPKGDPDRTVVITHHFPHRNSCAPQWSNVPLTAIFGSNLPNEVLLGARLWIHGHTHDSCNYRIGDSKRAVWDSPEITDTFLNAERARRVRNGKYPKEVWIRVQARSGQASNAARQCSCHGSAGPGRARERAAALDQGVRLRACRQSL